MKSGRHMWWVRSISAIFLLLFSVFSAHAMEFAAGVNVGTQGAGVALTVGLSDRFNASLGYSRFSTTDNFDKDGVNYDVDLELEGTTLALDWHPFGGIFRLTGGIIRNGNEVTGVAQLTGNVTIGPTTYTPAQVGTLNADISFDDIAGYLGVGWGNAVASNKGLTFSADLGVMFTGAPTVELTQVGGVVTIPESDLTAEEQALQSDIDEFVYYPIVRLGMSYHF